MPSSSRRKQSKPQHLTNDTAGSEETGGAKTATSKLEPTGKQSSQELQYKLHVEENTEESYQYNNGYGSVDYDDEEESVILDETDVPNLEELIPQDLSVKVKDKQNDNDLKRSNCDENEVNQVQAGKHGINSISTETKEHLEQHLSEHSIENNVSCHICHRNLKSKDKLQHHLLTTHEISTFQKGNVNIAQQQSRISRKRPLDEDSRSSIFSTSPASNDSFSDHSDLNKDKEIDMASKGYIDESMTSRTQYHSEMPPHLMPVKKMSYDSHMRAYEAALKSSGTEMVDPHVCTVCTKMFPKPSDLKRHMMCHTGEKPFRCEYCNKPFRAKSSMHYHLKATHGVDIELSPGLEERYLRMKTRAQMNLLQRGHLTGLTQLYGSESGSYRRDNVDFDDLEDDAKSTDSFCQNLGIGSDGSETVSQGKNGQTGNGKMALDLSKSGSSGLMARGMNSTLNGELASSSEAPPKRSKLSVKNETILVTRLDGLDTVCGENSSVFKCYLCSEMLPSLSKMQNHLSIHNNKMGVVNYQCCFCDETFRQKVHMQDHMRGSHSADVSGLYNNKDSSFMYDSQSNEDRVFSCRFCFKTFDNLISHHKHMRLHSWNKNFCCKICGKTFNQYTSLQVHISRIHWKTVGKSKFRSSWVRSKQHFVNVWRMPPKLHKSFHKSTSEECLNLTTTRNQNTSALPNQNVTIVMPQSPSAIDGNISDAADTGFSNHSSDNNWSEPLSDNQTHHTTDDGDVEIRTAPKRSLLPLKRDLSPRGRLSRKSTPVHLSYQNHTTSDNELPLNFSKSDRSPQDTNNNEASNGLSPELQLPITASNPEAIMPGYALGSTNHLLMAKALAAHQSLTHHLNNTSQPMIFPPNHLPPSLAAMNQMMSLPVSTQLLPDARAGTSKSPSPASHSSSKSDTSPEDRDSKEGVRESILGYPRFPLGQEKGGPLWSFNMYSPPDTGHTDGRKVTSLSRTHSRLGIVQSPINRESMCKATTLTDGRTVYKCPFCSKEFVSYSDINRHMDFHEDIRPYKCHYCDYYARTNSQLKVHMMRHQGIREFCCKLCNYKGVTQSDLNRHMKSQIHMLKSRNACTYCGEGFVTTKNLEKHLDGNCIVKMQKLHGGLDLPLQERVA